MATETTTPATAHVFVLQSVQLQVMSNGEKQYVAQYAESTGVMYLSHRYAQLSAVAEQLVFAPQN